MSKNTQAKRYLAGSVNVALWLHMREGFAILRPMVLGTIFCACATVGPAMNAHAEDDYSFPPVMPEGERVVAGDPAFVTSCLSKLEGRLLGSKIVAQLVTESDRWGPVLRMDVELPHEGLDGRVQRVVCWQRPDGLMGVLMAIEPPLRP